MAQTEKRRLKRLGLEHYENHNDRVIKAKLCRFSEGLYRSFCPSALQRAHSIFRNPVTGNTFKM
jgi:hypothetical protein